MKPGFILALSLVISQPGLADITAQSIAFNCRNCHTQDDLETKPPSLEKLSAQEIRTALLAFKYDRQPATLMPRIAKGYSDAELCAVADYLGQP